MLEIDRDNLSVAVTTAQNEPRKLSELNAAVMTGYKMGFEAKELCPRIGNCAITVCHDIKDNGEGMVVDAYSLDCHEECPLEIGKETPLKHHE